ncbi:MAG: O-antigen ligase family protein, partial [Actinomycetota bacterium]|nr:O-antigen ligase family protein [Actinomycetota bacterium]
LAVWLVVRSLFALNPAVSFVGVISQHSGSAMWLLGCGWFALSALLCDRRSLRLSIGVVSVAGALFAAMGIVEAATTGGRAWGSAAGPFENSLSLGTFLAIALLTAVAWSVSSRSAGVRLAGVACAALCAAGILAADSRTGMIGVAAGAVVATILHLAPRGNRTRRVLSISLPLAAIVLAGVLAAAASGVLGAGGSDLVRTMGTDRDAIWRSAVSQIAASPLIGSGPEQFSAWIRWTFDGADIDFNGTYDPHSAILGLALGGGLVAVLLWLLAAGTLVAAQIDVCRRAGRARAPALLAALPAVLITSALFSWLTPAAFFTVAALTGALLGAGSTAASASAPVRLERLTRPLAMALAVSCAITGAVSLGAFGPERDYLRKETLSSETYAEMYRSWPEPAFASTSLKVALEEGAARSPADFPDSWQADTRWHVDLALRGVFVSAQALNGDSESWKRFESAIERGIEADPASGLWATLASAQAHRLGRDTDTTRWTEKARGHRLDPATRGYLDDLANP